AGIAGLGNLLSGVSLSLNVINNIINNGTISSAGNLNLTAGGMISNTPAVGSNGPAPVITAASSLFAQAPNIVNAGQISAQSGTLSLATANLINRGLLESAAGSLSIRNLVGTTLSINNVQGVIAARDEILLSTLGTVFDQDRNVMSKAMLVVDGGELNSA